MAFSYKPLMKTLIDQNINKMQLRDMVGFSSTTLSKLSKGEYVSMKVLDDICTVLNCEITDVIEHLK